MRRLSWIAAGCVLAAALSGATTARAADAPGKGPLARAFRGVTDIVICPLEVPATVRRVAEERDAFFGLWAGGLEGVGNCLVRATCGVVEICTFPIPGDYLPLDNRRLGERAMPPARPPVDITRP
ncbi:MAG: exosortase system-associated protein, TIGR04073 family [Candidatus Brocadiia bacterium]